MLSIVCVVMVTKGSMHTAATHHPGPETRKGACKGTFVLRMYKLGWRQDPKALHG